MKPDAVLRDQRLKLALEMKKSMTVLELATVFPNQVTGTPGISIRVMTQLLARARFKQKMGEL